MLKRRFVVVLLVLTQPLAAALPRDEDSAFALRRHPEKVRGYVWRPIGSFFLPGLDQWVEGQYPAATAYSGLALAGIGMTVGSGVPLDANIALDSKNDRERFSVLGAQMYMAAGSYSAYHSFRTAVRSRPDDFSFLTREESPGEVLVAPVRFDYLIRPTTFVPLALGAAIVAVIGSGHDIVSIPLTGSDCAFAGSFSYLAGTNEEALFRGWMMPLWMRVTGNRWAADGITALTFGAAHISQDNPVPWPQLLMGAYLGWLSQYRDWTISESIFVHTWWDVMAFLGEYAFRERGATGKVPALYLPPVMITF